MSGTSTPSPSEIAIVGMGCLFPASPELTAFWRMIYRNHDAICDVPETHWAKDAYHDPKIGTPDMTYCVRGGYLDPYPFDPSAFGIPPNLLSVTDTSQLLSLVTARAALDDAGYSPDRTFDRSRVSVVLGATGTQELVVPLASRLGHPEWRSALAAEGISREKTDAVIARIGDAYTKWEENAFPGLLGNVIAGRISNRLNLGGTNCVTDAACASSLAALHLAVLELASGNSDMVVSGGVDTLNDIFMHMCFAQTGVLSHSGDARPFSEAADGTILGEGIGMLVLKRLSDAKASGDRIYAVLKGVGTASDGRSLSIYAPSEDGQARALKRAYEKAGVDPLSLDLIEAHGTGTRVGDAVEFRALQRVQEEAGRSKGQKCVLGSVKANMGHTKAAAGAAGLIKTVLALHHKVLPAALKARPFDPELRIEDSAFHLLEQPIPWTTKNGRIRRAGVSSFGFGGADYHAVLEEYQDKKTELSWDYQYDVLAFSGDTDDAIAGKIRLFRKELQNAEAKENLPFLCHQSREAFHANASCRLLVLFGQDDDFSLLLDAAQTAIMEKEITEAFSHRIFMGEGALSGKLAFLFPGQGSQYPGMGRDLSCIFPEMQAHLAKTDRLFCEYAAEHRKKELLSRAIFPLHDETKQAEAKLRETDLAQPAIGSVSLGMKAVLERFGVTPQATCGHSYGELPALCTAGSLSEEDTLALSVKRGRYMAGNPEDTRDRGSMLAVRAPLDAIAAAIHDEKLDVILANQNSPSQGVLSGATDAIDHAAKVLRKKKIRGIKLPVAAAFHSPLVEDAAAPFRLALSDISIRPATIPVMANQTGTAYSDTPDSMRETLAAQLLSPVRFVDAVTALYADDVRIFVEVGPKNVLTGLSSAILKGKEDAVCMACDASAGKKSGDEDLLDLLCRLSALGYPVDWSALPQPPQGPKRNMTVWLTGANLKQKTKKKTSDTPLTTDVSLDLSGADQLVPQPLAAPENLSPAASAPISHTDSGLPPSPLPSAFSTEASLVEGIRTLQALQEQTTRAHEQFLAVQKTAGKTLEALLAAATQNSPHTASVFSPSCREIPSEVVSQIPEPIAPKSPAPPAPEPDRLSEDTISRPQNWDATFIQVISEHTGYPEDMIRTDMDLEADLGIDSIKRVEILSAFEAVCPAIAEIPQEKMAETRTLSDVIQAAGLTGIKKEAETHPQTFSVTDRIVAIISEKTGYPKEMIRQDMHLESDLGIDSIKRVEILSDLEKEFPSIGKIPAEELSLCHTISAIAAILPDPSGNKTIGKRIDGNESPGAIITSVVSQHTGYPVEMIQGDMDLEADLGIDSIKKVEILSELESLFPSLSHVLAESLQKARTIEKIMALVEGSPSGDPSTQGAAPIKMPSAQDFSGSLVTGAAKKSVAIEQKKIVWETVTTDKTPMAIPPLVVINDFASDLSPLQKLLETEEGLTYSVKSYQSLTRQGIHLLIYWDAQNGFDKLADLFFMLRDFGKTIVEDTATGSIRIVTHQDGCFGYQTPSIGSIATYAIPSLLRTLAKEWPAVSLRMLDLCDDFPAFQQKTIMKGLFAPGPLLLGFDGKNFRTDKMVASFLPDDTDKPAITKEDVLLVTGGAVGVTAACVTELIRKTPCHVVLLGRSPAPLPDPLWLTGIEGEAMIKEAILRNAFPQGTPSPMELEAAYRRMTKSRSIRKTLQEITGCGATVQYESIDIRDQDAVTKYIQELVEKGKSPTLWVHGAGVLADKEIYKKSESDFRTVFETKAASAIFIWEILKKMPLKRIALFSSVASLEGNTGQSDYALANGVLNGLAKTIQREKTDTIATAFCWGPWEGGMVTPSLARQFADQGVGLIPVNKGAKYFRTLWSVTASELMVHGNVSHPNPLVSPKNTEFVVDATLSDPLQDHQLNGRPTVPVAMMISWMRKACDLQKKKGSIKNFRLFSGIHPSPQSTIAMTTETAEEKSTVTIFEKKPDTTTRPVASADLLAQLPLETCPSLLLDEMISYPRTMDTVYKKILFHGPTWQVISSVDAVNGDTICATLRFPEQKTPSDQTDPDGAALLLDALYQLGALWSYEKTGAPALPTGLGILADVHTIAILPDHPIRVCLQIQTGEKRTLLANAFLISEENRLLSQIAWDLGMASSDTLAGQFKKGGIEIPPLFETKTKPENRAI